MAKLGAIHRDTNRGEVEGIGLKNSDARMSRIKGPTAEVCIVTSVHPAFDIRIFHREARSLAAAGYDVTIIAQHDAPETVDGIKIVALPRRRTRWSRMMGSRRVFRVAHQLKADIYHFHDPELLPVGYLLKVVTRARVIYDVHEDYREQILTKYWIPRILRKPLSLLFDFIEKRVSRRLDCVVVATEGIASRFGDGTVTVMNYPLVAQFPGEAPVPSGSPVFIYVGSLTEVRGISEVVRAMSCLERPMDARLRLYGTFVPESYEQVVRGLEGSERVDFMGWIAPEAAWPMMSTATAGIVCLHPLKRHLDSMPAKLFEYMAAGIPVIASNFPLWIQILEGDRCGLTVNPLDPRDIARGIQYFIDNPETAKRMGENGKGAALSKYSWESEGKKLVALYGELLGAGGFGHSKPA